MQTPLYLRYDGNKDAVVEGAVQAMKDFGEKYLLRREFEETPWPQDLPCSRNFVGGDPPSVRLLHYQNWPPLNEYFSRNRGNDVFGLDVTNTLLETDLGLPEMSFLGKRENLSGRGNVLLPDKAVVVMTRHGFDAHKSDAYNRARAYVLTYRTAAALPLDKVPFCEDEVCLLRNFKEDFETTLDQTVTRYLFEKELKVCEQDQRALARFEQLWDVVP